MVRGIKADRRDVAKGADHLAVVGGTKRVAAVFDEPQVVLLAELRDRAEVEDIAERVGDHDRLGLLAAGSFQLGDINLIGRQDHIDEDRHEFVLEDRIHGGRESGGDCDDLIAGLELAIPQLGRGQGAQGHQVRA